MKYLNIAIALIWRDGKILATRRRHDADHLPDMWEFPGGKCEPSESPQHCVRREVREEVGIDIVIAAEREPIRHLYTGLHVRLHPFDCAIVNGEPQPIECAEVRWLAPDELDEADFPPANVGLIQALKRNHRDAY